ncbi:type VI secretion system-associated FHA domain protein TagH [Variovorax sp. WS11]|uniref:type VI secretion system-associated FHA domain protein TagH n=1 Tax=Variovorax sp. WS11 TaxID=1105204 RepID=UPI000D0D0B7E|nr:type VI secretion system-associated FHA domain protein TagH [Variovorax sp. WS11]NDZ13084.1 type VI secretion system-associated FHA domain protein TagH [Variovorax sp. WS11]PSL83483.1 type VI secretion system-associated FHA domain protein TagH [Variovorax sp. WS11]
MIRIAVISHQGAPAVRKLAAQFGADGGTIGRAPTNALVLDDPDRTVSRVHAQVLCRDGRFFIVDRGSNPMLCNGHPLGAGHEAALSQGDRLVIGGFELVVEMLSSQHAPAAAAPAPAHGHVPAQAALPTDDDPFADLLAGLGPAAPAAAPAAMQAPAPAGLFPDPLGAGRAPSASADDPFADLLAPSAPASGGAAAPARGLPLDDFSDLGLSASPKSPGIDELFGIGGSGGGDPLASSPLGDPLRQPNTASAADPLAALQGTAASAAKPRSDHLPVGQFAYTPPREVAPPPPVAPRFDDMTGEAIRAAPVAPVAQAAPPAVTPATTPVAQAAPPAATPAAPPDALLAAFLRGLGSTHQAPQQLTPELMERIGVLLRSATEGTLQLLLTRQEFKRELRAEVTMIAAQANNPLKFSPTAEVALAHLLGPGMRGFLPAEAAMRDAFDDLRSHQFGVMVGMRAALAQVIERFAPAELEKKIAARSALDSLFAANRKAKLWDQFIALYGGIASEAEDDFHALFGKAFLEAYEAQMARLKSGGS